MARPQEECIQTMVEISVGKNSLLRPRRGLKNNIRRTRDCGLGSSGSANAQWLFCERNNEHSGSMTRRDVLDCLKTFPYRRRTAPFGNLTVAAVCVPTCELRM
jgi:hypothetical protein